MKLKHNEKKESKNSNCHNYKAYNRFAVRNSMKFTWLPTAPKENTLSNAYPKPR